MLWGVTLPRSKDRNGFFRTKVVRGGNIRPKDEYIYIFCIISTVHVHLQVLLYIRYEYPQKQYKAFCTKYGRDWSEFRPKDVSAWISSKGFDIQPGSANSYISEIADLQKVTTGECTISTENLVRDKLRGMRVNPQFLK